MEKGVQRWLVDISKWNPSEDDFAFALSLLPQHEHCFITRYLKTEDRKRALVSRLLQYALVHEVLGIPFDEIIIKRTFEGKPYLDSDKLKLEFPNFNFNASHHGDFVAIASEPLCLVGLDIVSQFVPGHETIPKFIQDFSPYYSSSEWTEILNARTPDEMLCEFYKYWALKEAYVKAIGTGVGYRMDRVEFVHSRWSNISVKSDGKKLTDWRFSLSDLGKGHWISVARGHPRMAGVSFKRTLKQTEFCEKEYLSGLHLPDVSFKLWTMEELIDSLWKARNMVDHRKSP
ncbi:4'-phosphopantetheinyl transferase domain [Dillenia turbinata]|uniref:holo-[acyl-carrier-protein] synthase n=1 Tax=Dillenia turbinata TaxID=194707 RepID=A0AAN8VFL7_9MAGN